MGNCVSCLGSDRRDSTGEDEEAQLLFGDTNGVQYGSFGQQHTGRDDDPVEAQREAEALQRVVARTSDNLVDVFEIAPPDRPSRVTPSSYIYADQDARMARYQSLLTRLSTNEEGPAAKAYWLQHDDGTVENQDTILPLKIEAGEPLVGNFADAAAAMR